MFDFMQLYEFQMLLTITMTKNGVSEMTTYSTDIERFAVLGGAKRSIRRNGANGMGDADIMSEFYQAKQFKNLTITRRMDELSLVFRRLYDRQMNFEFTFTVKSLSTESRFRHLQLVTKKARISKPPSSHDGDTMNITFADPQVFYFYTNDGSGLVSEKI